MLSENNSTPRSNQSQEKTHGKSTGLPRLPHSPEAERALLGGIILGADGPWLDASEFFLQFHQSLCRALARLKREGKPTDDLSLLPDLLTPSELQNSGGIAYIAGLLDGLPKVANLDHYAKIISDKSWQRRAIAISEEYGSALLAANGSAGEVLGEFIAKLNEARSGVGTDPSSFRELFHSYDELVNAPPLSFAIRDFLQNDGITMIGGPSGHGKTFIMLSMVKALLTGNSLWNHFPVMERAVRVIYLVPESAIGPFAHRLKLFGLLPFTAPDNGRLLVRTLSKGPAPKLGDPRILSAAKGTHVFLDTAVRFSESPDENGAAQNQAFAEDLFALLASGARTVTGAHHSPKGFAKETVMTLENVLRGSGDIGAMLATGFGVKQIDKNTNTIHVENVKPRDFTPPLPFQLIGRPSIDETGDLVMLKKPGECGSLAEEQPENPANESKHREKNDRVAIVASWLNDDPDVSAAEIAEKFNRLGIDVDRSTASRYRAAARGRVQ